MHIYIVFIIIIIVSSSSSIVLLILILLLLLVVVVVFIVVVMPYLCWIYNNDIQQEFIGINTRAVDMLNALSIYRSIISSIILLQ